MNDVNEFEENLEEGSGPERSVTEGSDADYSELEGAELERAEPQGLPPVVAIVGRPNVGKSTLFNRIAGAKKAVVLDTPGVTRDRNYTECEFCGRDFMLIDTGGYDPEESDSIAVQMCEQVQLAIDEADVLVMLADGRQPDHPVDQDMAQMLRRTDKPLLLAVNKCDNMKQETDAFQFGALGLGDAFPISALHGAGVAELLEGVLENLPERQPGEASSPLDALRIAVIGRQNVGKSTLVNRLLGEERVIANAQAGTTRDAVDAPFVRNGKPYVLIDTAGIRRRGKIERGIEKLCVMTAMFNLKRCDVALIVINAEEGIKDQDTHIAGFAEESGRLPLIVVNKWDAVIKDAAAAGEFAKEVRRRFKFLSYVPIQFISAKTGDRVERIFDIIDRLLLQYRKEVSTAELNRAVRDALGRHAPPMRHGRRIKINYAVQTGTAPPIFSLFVNDPKLLHFSYRRYLVNRLRETLGLTEAPLWVKLRKKRADRDQD